MKTILKAICLLIFLGVGNQSIAQDFDWATQGSGAGTNQGTDIIYQNGNVYVTGKFQTSISWGATTLTTSSETGFVACLDTAGNAIWAIKDAGGAQISSDGYGFVYAVGGENDNLVYKIDTAGNLKWSRAVFSGTGNFGITDIHVIPGTWTGRVYLTGYFTNDLILDGDTTTSNGGEDMWITRCDTAISSFNWHTTGGGPLNDRALGVQHNFSLGGPIVTGFFQDTATFYSGYQYGNSEQKVSAGGEDVFIFAFDGGGHIEGSSTAGFGGNDRGVAITNGIQSWKIYVTGEFNDSIKFENNTIYGNGAGQSVFVGEFSNWGGGNNYWAKSITTSTNANSFAGNIVLCDSTLVAACSTDGNPVSAGSLTDGGYDITDYTLVGFDYTGQEITLDVYGSYDGDKALGITTDGENIYSTGYHSSGGNFSPFSLTAQGHEAIVGRIGKPEPAHCFYTASVYLCPGDSAFLGGAYQTVAGNYNDTITMAGGCDSVWVTSLIFSPVHQITDSVVLFDGDSLLVGGAYQTANGAFVDSLSSSFGCDSIVNTVLSFVPKPDPLGMEWVLQGLDSNVTDYSDQAEAIAIDRDAQNNLIVGGEYTGNLKIVDTWQTPGTGYLKAIFVASLTDASGFNWATTFQSTGGVSLRDVKVAPNGTIGVSGSFKGDMTISGTTYSSGNVGYDEMFFLVLSATGTPLHVFTDGYTWSGIESINAITTDASSNFYITGIGKDGGTFGGTTLNFSGSGGIVVAKFSPTAVVQWVNAYGTTASFLAEGLTIGYQSVSNRIVVAGRYSNNMSIGSFSIINSGQNDIFLAAFDPSGTPLWAHTFGSDRTDGEKVDLWTTPTDEIYMTGAYRGTAQFGSFSISAAGNFYDDYFLSKHTSTGTPIWVNHNGGEYNAGWAVTEQAGGNPVSAGDFNGFNNFFGGIDPVSQTGWGIQSYLPNGDYQWAVQANGSSSYNTGNISDLVADPFGNIFFCGKFSDTLSFPDGLGDLTHGYGSTFMVGRLGNFSGSTPSMCTIVENLKTKKIQDTIVTLSWDTIAGATAYKILYKESSQSNWTNSKIKSGNKGIIKIVGLNPATKYKWTVRAKCDTVWSDPADQVTFTTLNGPCLAPTGLFTNNVITTQAKLNWNHSAGAIKYRVRWRVVGTKTWNKVVKGGTKNFHWVTGLGPSTAIEWQVKTVCAQGASSGSKWSVKENFTTPAFKSAWTNSEEGNTVSVFPNPSNGNFTVRIENTAENATSVQLVNGLGQVVLSQQTNGGNQIQIEGNHLPAGWYLLLIESGDQLVRQQLIIE